MIILIVAVDNEFGIGKNGLIPWKIREDTQMFYDITTAKPNSFLIFGMKSYLPLSGRRCLSVSRSGMGQFSSVKSVIEYCKNTDYHADIFICGGSGIYAEAMELGLIDRSIITTIDKCYNCDKYVSSNLLNQPNLRNKKTFNVIDESDNSNVVINVYTFGKELTTESTYTDLLYRLVMATETKKMTRNAYTHSIFGETLRFDLREGFPIITTKKTFYRGAFEELMWFLRGDTNANHLSAVGVNVWNANSSEEFLKMRGLNYAVGDIGEMYGFNWRHFGAEYIGNDANYSGKGFDQIQYLIDTMREDPFSRRLVLTAFNPSTAHKGVLFPCHIMAVFNISHDYLLCCHLTIRSSDVACGLPFNILHYSFLIAMLVEVVNAHGGVKVSGVNNGSHSLSRGTLMISISDAHLYSDHIPNALRQCLHTPLSWPRVLLPSKKDIRDYQFSDVIINKYDHYSPISYKLIA